MVSKKNNRQRKQRGGGEVAYPIQWFNPDAKVPAYYPPGSEALTKQYESAYGPINAVDTTQPNSCHTQMGPNLAPFSPYEDVSNMTGGAQQAFQQIVNPFTNRKVNIHSRLGKQILQQYIKQLSQ